MKYLLVKEKNNKFTLYCPETYGMNTWGESSQLSLEKKRKYWYMTHWTAGNDYIDDVTESYKLNVVLETPHLQQVISYITAHVTNNRSIIESILVQAQEIYHDYVALGHWAASRN